MLIAGADRCGSMLSMGLSERSLIKRKQPVVGDLLNVLPDTVVMVDARGLIAFVNEAAVGLLGYPAHELIDQPLSILLPEPVRERHEAMVEQYRREGAAMVMGSRPVLQALHKSGRSVPVSISLCNIVLDGEALSVAVIRDASVVTGHLSRAMQLAETDALTELGNRLQLSKRMQELLARKAPFALLFIDLMEFKQINDRHGHDVGDRLLRIAAQRLRTQAREGDLAARFGGDEFVLLLDGLSTSQALERRAQGVAHHLGQPVRLDELSLELVPNMGGAICPRDGETEAELLAAADRRMYAAKRARAAYRGDDAGASPALT